MLASEVSLPENVAGLDQGQDEGVGHLVRAEGHDSQYRERAELDT